MTQEEKALAYDKAIEKIKYVMEHGVSPVLNKEDLQDIFHELAESEDELTWLTRFIKEEAYSLSMDIRDNEDRIKLKKLQKSLAWLEKQGEKPKKPIWKHWKDGIAGGAAGEQIFLIKIGRVYSISSCLGCECDYIELSELDKLMREEQGRPMWGEEDREMIDETLYFIREYQHSYRCKDENGMQNSVTCENWLKSLKQRMEE